MDPPLVVSALDIQTCWPRGLRLKNDDRHSCCENLKVKFSVILVLKAYVGFKKYSATNFQCICPFSLGMQVL